MVYFPLQSCLPVMFISALLLVDCCGEQMDGNAPKMVALAVVQSYNPRHKIRRSEISLPHLESSLTKAAYSAAQNSGNMLQIYLIHVLSSISF